MSKVSLNSVTQLYLNRFNLADFPNCTVCESTEENLYYILFESFESDLRKQLNIMVKEEKITVNLIDCMYFKI